ncbi:MAG: hypothetical protein RIS82_252 [Actinomycetota bacterium]|jgi:biotin transport system ATP-binding protein
MGSNNTISFNQVWVKYGSKTVLRNLNFSVNQRKIGVIGLNASGKSTAVRLLNGIVKVSEGQVLVHGIDPAKDPKAARQEVGFIFSNPDLQIIMPTVFEDVKFSLRHSGLSKEQIKERTRAALIKFGLLEVAEDPAHSLSGGQKQLLAICAIWVANPGLIVADEPTALLDAYNARQVANLLLDELEQQVVLVTHDMSLAARCDVVLRFENGRLEEIGEPDRVIANYLAAV